MPVLFLARQPDAGELPAVRRIKEIAIAATRMASGGSAGTPAQDHLVAHELAVVFTDGTRRRSIARVGAVGAGRPLPALAEELLQGSGVITAHGMPAATRAIKRAIGPAACGYLPLCLRWQPRICPARVGIGLIETDVGHRCVWVDWLAPGQGERGLQRRVPVHGMLPPEGAPLRPPIRQPQGWIVIAAVADEVAELAVADQSMRQRMGLQENPVPRAFIVKGEGVT